MKAIVLMVLALVFLNGCVSQYVWRPDHPDGKNISEYSVNSETAKIYVNENELKVEGVTFESKSGLDVLVPAYRYELWDKQPNQYILSIINSPGKQTIWQLDGDLLPLELVRNGSAVLTSSATYNIKTLHRDEMVVNKYDVVPTVGRVLISPLAFAVDIVVTPFALAYIFFSGFRG